VYFQTAGVLSHASYNLKVGGGSVLSIRSGLQIFREALVKTSERRAQCNAVSISVAILSFAATPSGTPSMAADARVADMVQAGKIRVAMFLPTYIKDSVTGEVRGRGVGIVMIEIARVLAARLGVEAQIIGYPTPSNVVECLKTSACDMTFMGIEPSRAAEVDFSPPAFHLDYTYLVPAGSTIHNVADVDQPSVRIAVVRTHASTLALTRIVKRAELVGTELPDNALDLLRAGKADAFAFPRYILLDCSVGLPGSRVLPDAYGVNRVGIAIAKGKAEWLGYISEFIEEAKASGLMQSAIERSKVRGVQVAPPGHSSAR
jgi:polar amino acid transport system substrate-binding protein